MKLFINESRIVKAIIEKTFSNPIKAKIKWRQYVLLVCVQILLN